MLALTPEMNATLRTPTQPASKEDDTPLIQLDVFHQVSVKITYIIIRVCLIGDIASLPECYTSNPLRNQ